MQIMNRILPPEERCTPDELDDFREQLNAITSKNLDQKEVNLRRSKLMKTDEWPKWEAAEDVMMDSYLSVGMYDTPVRRSNLLPNAVILRSMWIYLRKQTGRLKARNVCDGAYILRTPHLRDALGRQMGS